jgi:putative ABC transport system permease protein
MTLRHPINAARIDSAWLRGLVRHSPARLSATAAGVALAVGLLASLGAFLSASKATMTRRSIETVAVDWQIEVQPTATTSDVVDGVSGDRHIVTAETVDFAQTTGFTSSVDGTTHTTGSGQVIGITSTYRTSFPAQFRDLAGSSAASGEGVLLFQQTAANLAVAVGDTISVAREGLEPVSVSVDGIVDLPQADSLFQKVGAPAGAQASAPPDNVLILPTTTWHEIFDPLSAVHPDLVRVQIHARLDHALPHDPSAAYNSVAGAARNLELALVGSGLVGDNLGATLSNARSDALYAQVLFLFLGTPGAVLAGLLTLSVSASGRDRRRREQALLRTRGATSGQLVGLGITEAMLIGAVGSVVGLGLAIAVGRTALSSSSFGATTASAIVWCAAAVVVGFAIALASVALPARHDAHTVTVVAARRPVGRAGEPPWMRWGLDVVLLALAAVVYRLTARQGYSLVLAVEGVPAISVSYWAFAGPALLWTGAGLLTYRLTMLAMGRGRRPLGRLLRPVTGRLSDTVAASMQRQRRLIAHGAALTALTVGFAVSTAVFNDTYRQQAEVDAVLTNGADVTVTASPGAAVTAAAPQIEAMASLAGVRHVEPLQHRFAYVGADLQDLYGVNTATIVAAGRLQNAYFQGGSAASLMSTLGASPDSLLVSLETVHDFQLLPGDAITLRLQRASTNDYIAVPFHYVGVAKEFPTAPHDSFLVANADYIATMTGSDAIGSFLVDTGGSNTARVAAALRDQLGTSASVSDINSSRHVIGSSLTAVDLGGLTHVELGFALAMAAAATGLTLWLGLNERRRSFVILGALGANRRQLAAFVWVEAALMTVAGLAAGTAIGAALTRMLVTVLHGVFDPPPEHVAIPWSYLTIVLAIALAATATAAAAAVRAARTPHIELLRAL